MWLYLQIRENVSDCYGNVIYLQIRASFWSLLMCAWICNYKTIWIEVLVWFISLMQRRQSYISIFFNWLIDWCLGFQKLFTSSFILSWYWQFAVPSSELMECLRVQTPVTNGLINLIMINNLTIKTSEIKCYVMNPNKYTSTRQNKMI